MTIGFKNLCRGLGYNPDMVEKHILRGYFIPKAHTTQGKARAWSRADVFALAMFENLFRVGLSASEASQLAHLVGRETNQLLVVWPTPGRWSQEWKLKFVKARDFDYLAFLGAEGLSWAVPIDIDRVKRAAERAFEAAATVEEPALPVRLKKNSVKRRRPSAIVGSGHDGR